jgi:hypothetical protein
MGFAMAIALGLALGVWGGYLFGKCLDAKDAHERFLDGE